MSVASYTAKAKDAFNKLDIEHLSVVDEFYDENAEFQDPVHFIKGVSAIKNYYQGLYKNVKSIRFEFKKASETENSVFLEWKMFLISPSINSGRELTLDGVSSITFNPATGKVSFHRDYFDMGEFVYEKVPILGTIVRCIKSKMKGASGLCGD
jgi:hypothetical protein